MMQLNRFYGEGSVAIVCSSPCLSASTSLQGQAASANTQRPYRLVALPGQMRIPFPNFLRYRFLNLEHLNVQPPIVTHEKRFTSIPKIKIKRILKLARVEGPQRYGGQRAVPAPVLENVCQPLYASPYGPTGTERPAAQKFRRGQEQIHNAKFIAVTGIPRPNRLSRHAFRGGRP